VKPGIDSYCYHRFFGEIYPGIESDPGTRITLDEFLQRAHALGVAGVSLESCFIPDGGDASLARWKARLDALALERVWAWGHPRGLSSGADPAAADDLIRHIAIARKVGASVMRICCGGRKTRPASWPAHRDRLLPLLRRCVGPAAEHGVVLAIENHIDFLADELIEVITRIDSPWLGVCLDTANNLRILEDPLEAARKLAPYARATHVKDVTAHRGDPKDFSFWPSVPLGDGIVDIPAIFGFLRAAGYDGLLALEIDYLHPRYTDHDAAVATSIQRMKAMLQ
jgi:sugar phosphate isomerase/epimerase